MSTYTDEQLFSKLTADKLEVDNDLLEKAKNGDSDALHAIGSLYFEKEDYSTAMAWSLRSALKNNSNAQTALGLLHHSGLGIPVDYKLAMHWYAKAAALGHRAAQRNIGALYEEGRGVDIDKQQALEWYQRSAEQGLQEAKDKVEELNKEGVYLSPKQTMFLAMERKLAQIEKRFQSTENENKRLKRKLNELEQNIGDIQETNQLLEKMQKKTKKLRKKQAKFEQFVVMMAATL